MSNTKKPLYLKLFFICAISLIAITVFLRDGAAFDWPWESRIELKEGSIYLNGKKFFIKGVGYSPYRPDQWPGSPIPLDIVKSDFKRIKEAGFNTLRVWGTMPEEQLELAEKYDLKVIQAVALKPDVDFSYNGFIRYAKSQVRQMCKRSRDHPNVIMYLLMNEPHAEAVLNSGVENTLNLYKELINIKSWQIP